MKYEMKKNFEKYVAFMHFTCLVENLNAEHLFIVNTYIV